MRALLQLTSVICLGAACLAGVAAGEGQAWVRNDWDASAMLDAALFTAGVAPASAIGPWEEQVAGDAAVREGDACLSHWPCAGQESWYDTFDVFLGIDGAKQPQDLGINANLGVRTHAQVGVPLARDWGLGLQLGMGFNAHGNAVAVLEVVDGTEGRTQLFTTAGAFQRLESGWSWGLAYDYLFEDYYANFTIGQWRARVGYQCSACSEIGVWAAIGDRGDQAEVIGQTVNLEAIDMVNVYWNKRWQSGTQTMCWIGVADSHGEEVLLFPDNDESEAMPIFGAAIHAPLNNYLALYGEANLIMPADSGTVDAFLGFSFYPGGNAWRQHELRFAPLLPVANNTSFAVDLNR